MQRTGASVSVRQPDVDAMPVTRAGRQIVRPMRDEEMVEDDDDEAVGTLPVGPAFVPFQLSDEMCTPPPLSHVTPAFDAQSHTTRFRLRRCQHLPAA